MPAAAALNHYTQLQRLHAVVVASVRRSWSRMDPAGNWTEQYSKSVGPQIAAVVAGGQIAATREADRYIAAAINELGINRTGATETAGALAGAGIAGWAGDGRPISSLLDLAPGVAGRSLNGQPDTDVAAQQALLVGQSWLDMVSQTVIADTARHAGVAAMATRPWLGGWVRMVVPPCCSRCATLAGKFFKLNQGFQRHPRCKCVHIPQAEADYSDPSVNPDALFKSMTPAEQDRVFTNAGAAAIREGADIGQVVNARRGMSTAQINTRDWIPQGRLAATSAFGRGVFTTTESTTRRGSARRAMGSRPIRLMPESIMTIANNREDALRLLKLYGYTT